MQESPSVASYEAGLYGSLRSFFKLIKLNKIVENSVI